MSSQELTNDQQTSFNLFKEITNTEDDTLALQFLTQSNWNVDNAVNQFLSQSAENREPSQSQPQHQNSLTDFIINNIRVLFQARPIAQNPDVDTRRFITEFDQLYNPQHPALFDRSYQSCVSAAHRNSKFLLIYLHAPLHEDTERFCHQTFCTANFTQFVDQIFLTWAGQVTDPEAYSLSNQFNVTTFPCLLMLLAQTERTVNLIDRIQGFQEEDALIARLRGDVSTHTSALLRLHQEIGRRFGKVNREIRGRGVGVGGGGEQEGKEGEGPGKEIQKHEKRVRRKESAFNHFAHINPPQLSTPLPFPPPPSPSLSHSLSPNHQRNEYTTIREQQDREYRESEERDRLAREREREDQRLREKEAREAEEKRLREEEEERQRQEEEEAKILSLQLSFEAEIQRKKERLTEEPADGPNTTTIRFQLPQGKKLARRFLADQTVQLLFDFLSVHFHSSGSATKRFSVSTQYPKAELTNPDQTLKELNLFPRAMLYVHDLDT